MVMLKDTTLCAIVRDEMINPAGGIASFVESTVPFVDEAVIVDTGSKDGTREKLESLASQHRNLRVYDEPFRGFAAARNASLAHARTKYALVLDADELITRANFRILMRVLKARPYELGYNLDFISVFPPGENDSSDGKAKSYGHNPRLFPLGLGHTYRPAALGICGPEFLFAEGHVTPHLDELSFVTSAEVLHFVQSSNAMACKRMEWYEGTLGLNRQRQQDFPDRRPLIETSPSASPSDLPSFKIWKALNPRRLQYA